MNSERLRAVEKTGDAADIELRDAELVYLEDSGYKRVLVGWRAPTGKRTFFWREKAVHSQKAYDEFDMKFLGMSSKFAPRRVARDHCTRCLEHYDNCDCDFVNKTPAGASEDP